MEYKEIYQWLYQERAEEDKHAQRISRNPASKNEEIVDAWARVRTMTDIMNRMEDEFSDSY